MDILFDFAFKLSHWHWKNFKRVSSLVCSPRYAVKETTMNVKCKSSIKRVYLTYAEIHWCWLARWRRRESLCGWARGHSHLRWRTVTDIREGNRLAEGIYAEIYELVPHTPHLVDECWRSKKCWKFTTQFQSIRGCKKGKIFFRTFSTTQNSLHWKVGLLVCVMKFCNLFYYINIRNLTCGVYHSIGWRYDNILKLWEFHISVEMRSLSDKDTNSHFEPSRRLINYQPSGKH